jgi:hypothetical protein
MKWGESVLEGGKNYDPFFLFSSKFQSCFISRMSVEESFIKKMQR